MTMNMPRFSLPLSAVDREFVKNMVEAKKEKKFPVKNLPDDIQRIIMGKALTNLSVKKAEKAKKVLLTQIKMAGEVVSNPPCLGPSVALYERRNCVSGQLIRLMPGHCSWLSVLGPVRVNWDNYMKNAWHKGFSPFMNECSPGFVTWFKACWAAGIHMGHGASNYQELIAIRNVYADWLDCVNYVEEEDSDWEEESEED